MTFSITTSRVFACARRTLTLLQDAAWPLHVALQEPPTVVFGGLEGNAAADEMIVVNGFPEDPSQINFLTMGYVMNKETFALRISVATAVAGQDGSTVFDRCEELADVIQRLFRDQTTGKPIGGFSWTDAYDCSCESWIATHPVFDIGPGPEGIVGDVTIDVVFNARI